VALAWASCSVIHRDSDHWLRDDVLTSQDLAGVRLPAALVVLSCCRTAGAALRPGDELVGLVRTFLAAGAAAVVLSQWSVDDLSTSLLMRELYRLTIGTDPDTDVRTLADALRRAAAYLRSMTRDDVNTAVRERLADIAEDSRAMRTVQVDSAALADVDAFTSMRAALAVSTDQSLRDAALEAEARREELWAAERDQHPFKHPHYWAPFAVVGDWRLPAHTADPDTR
jgi:CHAT domain-containing protein